MDNNNNYLNYNDNYNNPTALTGSPPKKRGFFKAIIAIILVVVLLALVAFGICAYLVTQNNYDDKFNTEPSIDIFSPLLQSIVLGKEQDVTDNDVNSLINYIMQEQPSDDTTAEAPALKITGVAVNFHQEVPSNLYIKMDYKGIPLTLTAQCNVQLDSDNGNIIFSVAAAKLGELPVSPKMIFDYFKTTPTYQELPQKIQLQDNNILIPAGYSTDIEGYNFDLSVVSLNTDEAIARVQTTSALDSITDIITKYIFG